MPLTPLVAPRGGGRPGRRGAGRRPGVDDLLEPRAAPARPTARRSSAAWPPSGRAARFPPITAVLDGVPRVGVDADRARPDLRPGPQGGRARPGRGRRRRGWAYGATTVSGLAGPGRTRRASACSRPVASAASTAGAEVTGDISADLDAIAHHPLVTVCAGRQGLPRPAPDARAPRDGRRAGAGLAARLVPGLLHPLVGAARAPPGRLGRRRWPTVLAHRARPATRRPARRAHPRGRRPRRRRPRSASSSPPSATPRPAASPARR